MVIVVGNEHSNPNLKPMTIRLENTLGCESFA